MSGTPQFIYSIYIENINKMEFKEQVEFIIFLKQFKTLKFWYKGQYCLRIQIFEELKNQPIQYAYPYLISSQKIATPKTIVQQNGSYYESKMINIYFQSQQFIINDCCSFKMQYSYKNANSCTKMKVGIYKNKRIRDEKEKSCSRCKSRRKRSKSIQREERTSEKKRKVSETKELVKVAEKTVQLKRSSNKQINIYKCFLFRETEYFGQMFMYIGSIHLGWKLRKKPMVYLTHFITMPKFDRQELLQSNNPMITNHLQAIRVIKKNQIDKSLYNFYNRNVVQAQNNYQWMKDRLSSYFSNHPEIVLLKFDRFRQNQQFDEFLREHYEFVEERDRNYKKRSDVYEDYFYIQILKESYSINNCTRVLITHFCIYVHSIMANQFKEKCMRQYNELQQKIERICVQTQNAFERQEKDGKPDRRENFMIQKERLIESYPVLDNQTNHWPLILFQHEKSVMNSQSSSAFKRDDRKGKNLVVFVHGYQGNQYDLQKASNYLTLATNEQKIEILIVKDMDTKKDDINSMGKHLAHEIKKQVLFANNQFISISFIGYSLGGIIIRAALPYLSEFKNKFNLFMTLSSPHIGTSIGENNLVKVGVWYMAKIQKVKSMEQLHHYKKDFMNQLCQNEGLGWFKKLVLTGCRQDEFVPYNSALVRPELIESEEIRENAENLIRSCRQIDRLQIWFNAQERSKNLDKILGRKSHIEFIDNDIFLEILFRIYGQEM